MAYGALLTRLVVAMEDMALPGGGDNDRHRTVGLRHEVTIKADSERPLFTAEMGLVTGNISCAPG